MFPAVKFCVLLIFSVPCSLDLVFIFSLSFLLYNSALFQNKLIYKGRLGVMPRYEIFKHMDVTNDSL